MTLVLRKFFLFLSLGLGSGVDDLVLVQDQDQDQDANPFGRGLVDVRLLSQQNWLRQLTQLANHATHLYSQVKSMMFHGRRLFTASSLCPYHNNQILYTVT